MIKLISRWWSRKKHVEPPVPSFFESDWYLQFYPDVARAQMSAWTHFNRHGRYEGRFASEQHTRFWCDANANVPKQVESIAEWWDLSVADKNYFVWVYARWHALHDDWSSVVALMSHFDFQGDASNPHENMLMPCVLFYQSLCKTDPSAAVGQWKKLVERYQGSPVIDFLTANHQLSNGSVEGWLESLNHLYQRNELSPISLVENQARFDALIAGDIDKNNSNESCKVSVIIPVYNAVNTLPTALRGLLQQTWKNLEIIIVDDASTDNTLAIAYEWQQQDHRISVIPLKQNQGAYAARNAGMQAAIGDFLTVHDADDWSHPMKLALQAQTLIDDESIVASLSHWTRVSKDLELGSWKDPSGWSGLCHRNISSLMIRRQVIEEIGFWDKVRCSADTEYYYRLQIYYGQGCLKEVLPGVPLAMGRLSTGSLTQQSALSIFTIYSGVRRAYARSYNDWHRQVNHKEELYMRINNRVRLFNAPSAMTVESKE